MEEKIKELTLLLLYLTAWKEEVGLNEVQKSWKGYPFEIINQLTDEGFISGSNRAKSVYFTEEGIEKSKELAKHYIIDQIIS